MSGLWLKYEPLTGECQACYSIFASPVTHFAGQDGLRASNLTHTLQRMIDYRDWFKSVTGKRVTAEEIGETLGLSRASATRRLTEDKLTSDEIITLCRKLGAEPVMALVDLNRLTVAEVFEFMDSDGTALATASTKQLVFQLAETELSAPEKLRLAQTVLSHDELAARRSNKSDSGVEGVPYGAVADSSPDEDALREQEEGDAY